MSFLLLSVVTNIYVFSHFPQLNSSTTLFINLKDFSSKLFFAFCFSLVFISMYGFSQAFWLNLIILWNFFKINPWFNACFKFLMWMTYSVSSRKLVTSFSTFSILILSGKNGKSLWSSCNVSKHWTSTSRKYPSSLSLL